MKNSPTKIAVSLGSGQAAGSHGPAARPQPAGAVISALIYPSESNNVGATLILGHGAGAGQDSSFMVSFARALSERGLDVMTFNFPYIEQKRKIPDRPPVLEACFRSVVERAREEIASARTALFIGGKSMGGRIATQVAAADQALPIAGLVLLGYPLHPPGKPDQRRDKHLPDIKRPMLFVHGTRDAFGTPAELKASLEPVEPAPVLHLVDGGDHSFKISRKDPKAQAAIYASVQDAVVSWIAP